MDDENVKNRELRAIVKTAKFLKTSKNFIITFNEEAIVKIEGITIKIIPSWQWLLDR